ncbi:unnamed protein product [Rhizoctonia solani]|uniref:DyP dimeric alpha+beta barrel domain-containing protein n=1 Tax=Rhizoctonia solani TaxID=456999 RepID=A0A8H3BZB3_9AGAM|nr:unnamed protein product [Rhizoctonia solani]
MSKPTVTDDNIRRINEEHKRLLKYLRSRAQIPRIPESEDHDVPSLDNVQGDSYERFVFFRINGAAEFKKALLNFKPTSAQDVKDTLLQICRNKDKVITAAKKKERERLIAEAKDEEQREAAREKVIDWTKLTNVERHDRIPLSQRLIAFSRTGLSVLGQDGNTGDKRFDERRMREDRVYLGDQSAWHQPFSSPNDQPPEADPSKGTAKEITDPDALHGVIVIARDTEESHDATEKDLKATFGTSLTIRQMLDGKVRPQPYKDHEHFGFKDGISQPAINKIEHPLPGQIHVDPGVIVMGYPGDPVPKSQRPLWCKDGTMMVFRKLEQSVLLFEQYCQDNGSRWREFFPGGKDAADRYERPLSNKEGAELFAAQMVGRWKSGAPLALAPIRDDPILADDPKRNNDFDYSVTGVPGVSPNRPSNFYCPFTAHTRKTGPRNLDPYASRKHLASSTIVRAGIPYGEEVKPDERKIWKKDLADIKTAHVSGATDVKNAEDELQKAKVEQAQLVAKVDEAVKEVRRLQELLEQDPKSDPVKAKLEAALKEAGAARVFLEKSNEQVTRAEKAARAARVAHANPSRYPKEEERGLLFVCYASHLDSGFVRQTVEFGNNDFFPGTEFTPAFHGQDPIIGGPPARKSTKEIREVGNISNIPTRFTGMGDTRVQAIPAEDVPFRASHGDQVHFEFKVGDKSLEVSGLAQDPSKDLVPPATLAPGADNPYFVTSRGGEYFFVPSLQALKDLANLPEKAN